MDTAPFVNVTINAPDGSTAPDPQAIADAIAQVMPTARVAVSITGTLVVEPSR